MSRPERRGVKPISERQEAKLLGIKVYNNGPCRKGHIGGRYTSNGSCIECVKEFSINNPEVNHKAVTRYQKNNKDKIAEVLRRWRKKNPEKAALNKHIRRGAKGVFTKNDIDELRHKQNNLCAICDEPKKLEIDHIIPVSKGGTNWPSNLQLLCRNCNAQKSDKLLNLRKE